MKDDLQSKHVRARVAQMPEQSQERGQEDIQGGNMDGLKTLTLGDLDLYDGPSYQQRVQDEQKRQRSM